jgi:hypothetical protein
MTRINIRHDITPHTAGSTMGHVEWKDVADWKLLSEAAIGAAAASAYTFRTFPGWQSPAFWAGFEVIMSSPSSIRLAAIDYDAVGGHTIKTDWGPQFDCPVGVRSGQMTITEQWNAMCNGPQDRMLVFQPQVRGSGILYRAQLNLIIDIGAPVA